MLRAWCGSEAHKALEKVFCAGLASFARTHAQIDLVASGLPVRQYQNPFEPGRRGTHYIYQVTFSRDI